MKAVTKIIILFALEFTCQKAFSQNNIDFFSDTTQHFSISLGGNFSYGSSAMSNEFLNY